ncbi:hypothetical protein IAR50_007556 [Cryptococcus sp. DSM 104548]
MPSWFSRSSGNDDTADTLDPSLRGLTTRTGTEPTGYLLSYIGTGSFLNADSVATRFDAVLSPQATAGMSEAEVEGLSRTAYKLENLISRRVSYRVMERHADLGNTNVSREVQAASEATDEFAEELLGRDEYSNWTHVGYVSKRAIKNAAKSARTPTDLTQSTKAEVFSEIDEEVGKGVTREEMAQERVRKAQETRNQN